EKYDKSLLLTALRGLCTVPFIPVQYHCKDNRVVFYVDDASTANALCKVSGKITATEGHKVYIVMNRSPPPPSVLNRLKPEHLEQLKQCLSKRFDASQQALDLSSIRTDPDLVSRNIEVILNRTCGMQDINDIIEENIPELLSLNLSHNRLYKLDEVSELVRKVTNLKVLNLSHNELKSERVLDKVKGFKLEELWLEHNPLCENFKDQPSYISAIREKFPRLLRLDGHVLPRLVTFEIDPPTKLSACKGSTSVGRKVKRVIQRFLQEYYKVYDSGNRWLLLEAYQDGATFSLSYPFCSQNPYRYYKVYDSGNRWLLLEAYQDGATLSLSYPFCSQNPYRCSLEGYKTSSNVKEPKDPTSWFHLQKQTRQGVVALLSELPKTQHDPSSFVVDVHTSTKKIVSFTVTGVFKEVNEKSGDSVRMFSRTFITIPAANSGLCIVNDELFVQNAKPEMIRRAFATLAPLPPSSSVPRLTAKQQKMLSIFSTRSCMNLEWSQKCLQDNAWDFNRASQIFTQLKVHLSFTLALTFTHPLPLILSLTHSLSFSSGSKENPRYGFQVKSVMERERQMQ
ncbi:NXF1 factor, partial [Amia calva]|nr:NXF1 factor [Amia calva]